MLNDISYNENMLSPIEKDFLEEDSLNQLFTHFGHESFNPEEIKDDFLYSLNRVKTDGLNNNKKNNNNINKVSDEEVFNNVFNAKKDDIRENEPKTDSVLLSYNNNNTDNEFIEKTEKNNKNNLILSTHENNNLLNKTLNIKTEKSIFNDGRSDFFDIPSPMFDNNSMEKFFFPNNKKIVKINNDNTENKDNNNKLNKKSTRKNNNKEKKQEKPILLKRGTYKKKNKNIEQINFDDKCFPFKTGKGIINITTKYNKDFLEPLENKDITTIDLADEKTDKTNEILFLNNKLNEKNVVPGSENELYLMKFFIKKYYVSESSRRKRIKKKRKYKSDIIRKKIKSRFHKSLKYIINDNLKKVGSKMLFDCLPQCFIGNTNKQLNSKCLDLTYKELFLSDFGNNLANYRHTTMDVPKHSKNIKVLQYLESNPEICQKSGFHIIQNLKYKELLERYFLSAEFEDSLVQLKKENEDDDYIQTYIYRAKSYVDFFSNIDSTDKDNNEKNIDDKDDDEEFDDIDYDEDINEDDYNFAC